MKTSNTPDAELLQCKAHFEPANLDMTGYGPSGVLTRKQWIEECASMLRAGSEQFNHWQQTLYSYRNNPPFKAAPYDWTMTTSSKNSSQKFGYSGDNPHLVFDVSGYIFEDTIINLNECHFFTGAIFNGCTFNGSVCFSNCFFHDASFFQGVQFANNFMLTNGRFKKTAFFDYSIARKGIFCDGTTFEAGAVFKNTIIYNKAHFQNTLFASLDFSESEFNGSVDFSSRPLVDDNKQLFFGASNFSGTKFNGNSNFSNREFTGKMELLTAGSLNTFFAVPPIFHNCRLHQDTTFIDVDFPERLEDPKSASRAYNTLRLFMSQKQATKEEQKFLILELDAERQASSKGIRFLYAAYKFFSGYGFSTMRPLIALIALPMLVVALIFWSATPKSNCITPISLSCNFDTAVTYSIAKSTALQALPPIGLEKYGEEARDFLFKDTKKQTSPLIIFSVALQKILSLLGWFFVVLSIRNLFKMK